MAPVEQAKEVMKVAVETSGAFSSIWHYIIGGLATGVAGMWGHLTGRIGKLEDRIVGKEAFDKHVIDENSRFDVLFDKHDKLLDQVTTIGRSVARIEGKLDK